MNLHGVVIDPCQTIREGGYRIYDNLMPTVTARDWKDIRMVITDMDIKVIGRLDYSNYDMIRRVYDVDGIAPACKVEQEGQREIKILDTSRLRVRKLTPTEYGRLQAFPMGRWQQVVSNSQAYKQFGNAVTVSLFEAIARNIKDAIERSEG